MPRPLRALLASVTAAGFAAAQTPPSPTTGTPPQPVAQQPIRQIAFKVQPAMPESVTKVFDVTDLVSPPSDSPLAAPGDDAAMKAAAKTFAEVRAEQMMKVVRGTVQPDSWADKGGNGKMDFHEAGNALVVSHSPAAVMAVADLLDSLRKLQNTSVIVEMAFVTVPSGNAAMKKHFGDKETCPLAAEQLKAFMTAVQADRAAGVLSQPRVVVLNKQTATVQCGEKVTFLTGLTTRIVDGKLVTTPETQCRDVGLNSRVTPDVSADGKTVKLRLDVTHSEAARNAPLFPVTSLITPEFEGGSQGQPVPFTQFLQAPAIDTQKLETTVVLPAGGSMAIKIGKRKVEQRIESKVPILGDLPYLGRLFRNTGVSTVDTDFLAVVTVRLVENTRKTAPPPPVAVSPAMFVAPVPARIAVPQPLPLPGPMVMPKPMPMAVPPVAPATFVPQPLPPVPMPLGMPQVAPTPYPVAPPMTVFPTPQFRGVTAWTGGDGLQRIGVDFNVADATPAERVLVAVASGKPLPPADDTAKLMAAYKAACAAGKKDEAARIAVQLLAKDPTCFGTGR